jgi:hypothetical protein
LDIASILMELKAQRNKLNDAIAVLEALAPYAGRRSKSKTLASKPRTARPGARPSLNSSRRSSSGSAKIIPFRLPRRARTKPSRAEQA